MECLVCHQKIKHGEQIFFGSQGVCRGETDWDCGCFEGVEELVGVVHLCCLASPAETAKRPNMVVPEPVEESAVLVRRSDALSLLTGVEK